MKTAIPNFLMKLSAPGPHNFKRNHPSSLHTCLSLFGGTARKTLHLNFATDSFRFGIPFRHHNFERNRTDFSRTRPATIGGEISTIRNATFQPLQMETAIPKFVMKLSRIWPTQFQTKSLVFLARSCVFKFGGSSQNSPSQLDNRFFPIGNCNLHFLTNRCLRHEINTKLPQFPATSTGRSRRGI